MTHGELLHLDPREGEALRAERPSRDVATAMAERLRALGDPTRLELSLALRGGGELCVCDLSWVTQRPQALVSHHMKILRSAGLTSARREGKMVMYSLTEVGADLVAAASAVSGDQGR